MLNQGSHKRCEKEKSRDGKRSFRDCPGRGKSTTQFSSRGEAADNSLVKGMIAQGQTESVPCVF
jgi:hypothetical protein